MPRSQPVRSRPGLWIIACAMCAAAGFLTGRQPFAAAPRAPTSDSSSAGQPASDRVRSSRVGSSSASSDSSTAADAPTSARRRVLIDLLQRLAAAKRFNNMGDIIKLAAWVEISHGDDLAEALALGAEIAAEDADSPLRELVPLFVFNRWGAIDGPAALETYLALPIEQRSDQATEALFKSWSTEGDPQDALDHALALRRTTPEDDTIDESVIGEILLDWNFRDPASALAAARQLAISADEEEQASARSLAEKIASDTLRSDGADAALRWIDQWPDVAGRDGLRIELLDRLDPENETDRASTARIISTIHSADSLANSSYLRGYAGQLATHDIAAAQQWCATLPPAARVDSAGIISAQLAQSGRWREAVTWIETQTTDTDVRATTYENAAAAAAEQGELSAALNLIDRIPTGDPFVGTQDPFGSARKSRAGILNAWMQADPARSELLLRHALSLEIPPATSAATPAP